MGEASRQLKAHIDETRTELGHNIDDLEAKVKRTFNWRAQFEDHTAAAIGLAFGAGVLLSMITPPAQNGLARRVHAEFSDSNSDQPASRNIQRLKETWDRVKGALIGVAAMRAESFLDELLPGFQKAYEKLEREENETPRSRFTKATGI